MLLVFVEGHGRADLGHRLPPAFGGEANDLWGWTHAASGRQFALLGRTTGTSFVEITDPVNPVEIAYFDTYPADDAKNYNGLWSVYPYFPSGTVIGSDLERGLFVWQVGDPDLAFSYPNGLPPQIDPTGDTLTVEITPQHLTLAAPECCANGPTSAAAVSIASAEG